MAGDWTEEGAYAPERTDKMKHNKTYCCVCGKISRDDSGYCAKHRTGRRTGQRPETHCIYCGAQDAVNMLPPYDFEAAAAIHKADCEWVQTRAHTRFVR